MEVPPKLWLEHTRSTRAEGRRMCFHASVVLVVGGAVAGFLVVLGERGVSTWLLLGCVLLMAGVLAISFGLRNIQLNGQFVQRVFSDRIECQCPHPSFGESYRISFAEIRHLERNVGAEGPDRWLIVTKQSERFVITVNYGNPVDRIVALLRSAEPPFIIRET